MRTANPVNVLHFNPNLLLFTAIPNIATIKFSFYALKFRRKTFNILKISKY